MPSLGHPGIKDSTPPVQRGDEAATAQDAPQAQLGPAENRVPVASDKWPARLFEAGGRGG